MFARRSRWLNAERKLNLISLPARLSSSRLVNNSVLCYLSLRSTSHLCGEPTLKTV